ncbi:MAG: hypothetical protein RBU37_03185, partial [Myxococcota bacterium]|nr:hypothetical protein [Myxococcota bacterium]
VDLVVWGSGPMVNKGGVSVDGPDGDTTPSSYASDAGTGVKAADSSSGSLQRSSILEPGELASGGNGRTGHDESSENWAAAFSFPPASPGRFHLQLDGDIADLAAMSAPLAVSSVDGPGSGVGDFGGDGSLSELYGTVVDSDFDGVADELWLGVRGQFFTTDASINATFFALDVDPGSSTGSTRWFGPSNQLADIIGALDNDATHAGVELSPALSTAGVGFDAFVGVTNANCPSAEECGLRGLGSGGVTGSINDFAYLGLLADVEVGSVTVGIPAASGTGFDAPQSIEVRIPLSLLGTPQPETVAISVFTSADHTAPASPNLLPENSSTTAGDQLIEAVAYVSVLPVECITDADCGPCKLCQAGSCVLASDGTLCDDALFCTTGDQCVSGLCAGSPVDCSSFDDQCNVGVCNVGSGICEAQARSDDTSCDDQDPCTSNDVCTSGSCAGLAIDCSSASDQCNEGVCDSNGDCIAVPLPNTTDCDDNDPCTITDLCNAGSCSGTPKDCSALDGSCHVGICNALSGDCESETLPDSSPCSDEDLCTQNDACSSGVCVGELVVCPASDNPCVPDACDPMDGLCKGVPLPDGTECSDGDLCTLDDVCLSALCTGVALDCSGLDASCRQGVCNSTTGTCAELLLNDQGCDDDNACTDADTCVEGLCVGTPLPSGTDCGDACREGVCDALTGLCNAVDLPDGTQCDDENACTQNTACSAGECAGEPVDDGASCDDGDPCTVDDRCTAGECAGTLLDCSALDDDCNLGACDRETGECRAIPFSNGSACDDGVVCTTRDACVDGVCTGEAIPEGGACNDGDPCTSGERCLSGECTGGVEACLSDEPELMEPEPATEAEESCGCKLSMGSNEARASWLWLLGLVAVLLRRRPRRSVH